MDGQPQRHRTSTGMLALMPLSVAADSTATGDLLSQYDQPAHGPGFFSRLRHFFALTGSPAKAGSRAYKDKDYDRALQKFAEAALDAPG